MIGLQSRLLSAVNTRRTMRMAGRRGLLALMHWGGAISTIIVRPLLSATTR